MATLSRHGLNIITPTEQIGIDMTTPSGPSGSVAYLPTPGHWKTYTGKPLRDPPAGTFTYNPSNSNASDQTHYLVSSGFTKAKADAVWSWMLAFYDDGSLAKEWKGQKPDYQSEYQMYGDLLRYPPSKAAGNVALPDPGAAEAGVGPTGITSTLDFLKLLTQASTWVRVAEVAIGGLLILVAVAELAGSSSSVSKLAKAAML